AHHFKFLGHEEFVLLYDLNKPKNPEIPCRNRRFDIDDLCNDECQMNFRFFGNDIYKLTEVLNLADEIECCNGLVSVAAPNGFIANLYGPVEGKRHDSSMHRMSGILNQL
ncbi:hypothetical protein P5673_012163, partial [Acropora cervicornis]